MENKIKNFYDLDAWICARELAGEIYRLTAEFPKHEIFGMVSQMRRASTSIMANLAEGYSRYHAKDKTKFYYNARGSASEVLSFLFISKDLGYIDNATLIKLNEKISLDIKLINGLINYLKKTEYFIR